MCPETLWVNKLQENEIDLKLERMNCFMLDYGPFSYNVVHVGGTNGKGSVCQFITSVLSKQYCVGLYTSPHLECVNERIIVDGRCITNNELERYNSLANYKFTYFEALTASALLFFRKRKVDYAIMEVGLGGRLDATNVIDPVVTVITNVAKEHETYLGTTISKIAAEKAAIIKNAPVVTGCKGKSLEVVEKVAKKQGVDLFVLGKDILLDYAGPRKFIVNTDYTYEITSPLAGRFQGMNIAISIKTCELLGVAKKEIVKGIENTRMHGRMELLQNMLLDGCHNPHAVEAFTDALKEYAYNRLIVIFGVMRDKNVVGMLTVLPNAQIYIAVTLKNQRSMPSNLIATIAREQNKTFLTADTMSEALSIARTNAGPRDLICVIGSLYGVGEARKIISSFCD